MKFLICFALLASAVSAGVIHGGEGGYEGGHGPVAVSYQNYNLKSYGAVPVVYAKSVHHPEAAVGGYADAGADLGGHHEGGYGGYQAGLEGGYGGYGAGLEGGYGGGLEAGYGHGAEGVAPVEEGSYGGHLGGHGEGY